MARKHYFRRTKEMLEPKFKAATTMRELCELLEIPYSSTSITRINAWAKKFNLSKAHFISEQMAGCKGRFKTAEEFIAYIADSTNDPISTTLAKAYILKFKLKPYFCEGAGCTVGFVWQGKIITLQLHHKDGNNKNHVLSNVMFLCPNCHMAIHSKQVASTSTAMVLYQAQAA